MNARRGFSLVIIAILVTIAVTSTPWLTTDITNSQDLYQLAAPTGEQWEMTYGGSGDDRGQSIVEIPSGGFAVAGYTDSFGAGSTDIWFVTLDDDGNVLSNQTFGTSNPEGANDICLTSDDGYALAGFQHGASRDFYVVRLNSSGDIMWDFPYGTGAFEEAWSVIEDSDGFLVMTGATSSGTNAQVTKVNSTTGIEEWSFSYGGPGIQFGNGIIEVPGGYIVAGLSTDWSAGDSDMWLFMIDFAGVLQWNKTYGYTYADSAFELTTDSLGNLVLAGYTTLANGTTDAWMVITDPLGNHISNHSYGGPNSEYCQRIVAAADGSGFLLAGRTDSFGAGDEDLYMVRTDGSGVMLWDWTNGTSYEDRAYGVEALSDGGFIITGYSDTAAGTLNLRTVRLWYDTDPPDFTNLPTVVNLSVGELISFQVQVNEDSGMKNWWLNDTRFSISFYGYITNVTSIGVGTYHILVSGMDRYYNTGSENLTFNIGDSTTTTTTTSSTTSTTTTTTDTTTTSTTTTTDSITTASGSTTTTGTNTTTTDPDAEALQGLGWLMAGLGTGSAALALAGLRKLEKWPFRQKKK